MMKKLQDNPVWKAFLSLQSVEQYVVHQKNLRGEKGKWKI